MRCLGWAPIQYDWYPFEKGKFGQRHTEAHRVKVKAEIWIQAKKHQRLPGLPQKLEER